MPNASNNMPQAGHDVDSTLAGFLIDGERRTSLATNTFCGLGQGVTTALICDNPLLRSGLQHILSGTPFTWVEESSLIAPKLGSGTAQEPMLCILAVSQPSSYTPEMVRQLKERYPTARIVILANHIDLCLVTQGVEAGADGFCLTDSGRDVLITLLELIMLGESVLPGRVARSILNSMALSPKLEPCSKAVDEPKASNSTERSLSAREVEVLSCLIGGEPNKIIARKLHVAEATVKVHVKAILRKIGAANRTQAAIWAMDHLTAQREASLHG